MKFCLSSCAISSIFVFSGIAEAAECSTSIWLSETTPCTITAVEGGWDAKTFYPSDTSKVLGTADNHFIFNGNGAKLDERPYIDSVTVSAGTLRFTEVNNARIHLQPSFLNSKFDAIGQAEDTTLNNSVMVVNGGVTSRTTANQDSTIIVTQRVWRDDLGKWSFDRYYEDIGDMVVDGNIINDQSKEILWGVYYGNDVTSRAISTNSTFNGSAGQQVLANGLSQDAVFNDESSQYVGELGQVENATFGDSSKQTVDVYGKATGTTLNGTSTQTVLFNGEVIDTTLNGSSRSNLMAGSYASGTMTVNDSAALYMQAGLSNGAYAETVNLTSADSRLVILNDLDAAGQTTPSHAFVTTLDMNGGQLVFAENPSGATNYAQLTIGELSGTGSISMNSEIASRLGNSIVVGKSSGTFNINIQDTGREIADTNQTLNLINDKGQATYSLANLSGANINAIDGGTYMYTLKQQVDKDGMTGNVWYLAAAKEDTTPGGEEPGGTLPGGTWPGGSGNNNHALLTSPSTDAILSIASAGHNIFLNEMQTLQQRRGNLTDTGRFEFWSRAIGSRTNYDFGHANYRLNQKGIEFGADRTINVQNGKVIIGAAVSYTDNDVKHKRGGTSNIDSYSISMLASYIDDRGFYVDGILKANRFNEDINVRMTNGTFSSGSFNQNGIGAAVEAGYKINFNELTFIKPYVLASYYTAESKDIKLSNGMVADIGNDDSLRLETGATLGHTFVLRNGMLIQPHLRVAVEQEFEDSNTVVINRVNKFNNDFSGTVGKYGIGFNAQLADNTVMYGELTYRHGSGVETPIMGNFGVRVKF